MTLGRGVLNKIEPPQQQLVISLKGKMDRKSTIRLFIGAAVLAAILALAAYLLLPPKEHWTGFTADASALGDQ